MRVPFTPTQVAIGLMAIALVMLAVHFAVPNQAHGAQVTPAGIVFTEPECRNLAEIVQQAADARDAGIGQGAYLRYVRKRIARLSGVQVLEIRNLIMREIAAVHTSVLTAERLEQDVWTRCVSGAMGAKPEV